MASLDVSPRQDIQNLYNDHHTWLYRWLHKKLLCSDHAADLAHDTFVRVLGARRTVEIKEPRAYLTTIAKGILVNWYQRQAVERAYLEVLAILPETQVPSPERQFLILETLHEIDALLDALPAPIKQVFLLSQLENMKYEAIAAKMGLSLITIKRYMKQAFNQCLCRLEET